MADAKLKRLNTAVRSSLKVQEAFGKLFEFKAWTSAKVSGASYVDKEVGGTQ